jgi:hypothetical protein
MAVRIFLQVRYLEVRSGNFCYLAFTKLSIVQLWSVGTWAHEALVFFARFCRVFSPGSVIAAALNSHVRVGAPNFCNVSYSVAI